MAKIVSSYLYNHSRHFSIIWLDSSIHKAYENSQIQQQLSERATIAKNFDNTEDCETYIRKSAEIHLILIVNNQVDVEFIQKIHGLSQISYIYVYGTDRREDKEWRRIFFKIRTVTEKLENIIHAIEYNEIKHEQTDEPSVISVNNNISNENEKSSTHINGNFLHTQILIDFLQRMQPNARDKAELIALCKNIYDKNTRENEKINEFEKQYSPENVLRWYTLDSFVYRLLNKACRVFDIYTLFLFRFFIRDLHDQLVQLQNQQLKPLMTVYRGQLMSHGEFNILQQSIGKVISMNSFLSTTIHRNFALSFVPSSNEVTKRILFEIDVHSNACSITKPFADIATKSAIPDEDEVLFMLGSIFRINNIVQQNDGICLIQMCLCSDNDHDLKPLFMHLQYDGNHSVNDLVQFGMHLREGAYYDEAERIYQRALEDLNDDSSASNLINLALCYHELGCLSDTRSNFQASLEWYNKSLKINENALPEYHHAIAVTHNAIGLVYHELGELDRALEEYLRALKISNIVHGENSEQVAGCFLNIGRVHASCTPSDPSKVEKLRTALEYYEKALIIQGKCLPNHHPDLAVAFESIALVYEKLGEFNNALLYNDYTLRIRQKSLSANDPIIGFIYNNIGSIHFSSGNYPQAFHYFLKALLIYRETLQDNHQEIIKVKKNIQHAQKALTSKT